LEFGILMRDTVTGQRVIVRAYRPEHIDKLFDAVTESIPDLSKYETWCHPGYTREEAEKYVNWWRDAWSENKAYYYAVELCDTGEFLGSCGLSDLLLEHKRAGLGFWIRSSRTGQGYATEAASIIGRLAFADLGLERIEMETAIDNVAYLKRYCIGDLFFQPARRILRCIAGFDRKTPYPKQSDSKS
jgi:ribosomal-protein-serine acetyltransferase